MKSEIAFAFSPILNASKSKEYKTSVTKNCKTLMSFLVNRNLLKVNPFDENGEIKNDLVLYDEDFNEGAEQLFGKPVSSWFKYLDKGGNINNVSILEKGLNAIGKKK
jgi:hypothetical protein